MILRRSSCKLNHINKPCLYPETQKHVPREVHKGLPWLDLWYCSVQHYLVHLDVTQQRTKEQNHSFVAILCWSPCLLPHETFYWWRQSISKSPFLK